MGRLPGRGARVPSLRYWREVRALMQRELAEQAGVSTSVVSRLEAEEDKAADFPTIRKLAAALKVEYTDLMKPPPSPE